LVHRPLYVRQILARRGTRREFHSRWASLNARVYRSLWLVDEGFSLAEVGYAPYLARLRHLGVARAVNDALAEKISEQRLRLARRSRRRQGCQGTGALRQEAGVQGRDVTATARSIATITGRQSLRARR
jgi:glutathione S-transferase